MARVCGSPWAVWQSLFQSGGLLGHRCFGQRSSSNADDGEPSGLQLLWDACFPPYNATTVRTLEANRQAMALALAGQLTVVVCRVLTGHVGAGAVGLIVFIVGNNARCSLQASNLTSYVGLGFAVGSMDTVDLFQRLTNLGNVFFALPFETHMAQNLDAFALFLAPICEFAGARIAWDSYLSPSMLFEAQTSMNQPAFGPMATLPASAYYHHDRVFHPSFYHSLPSRFPMFDQQPYDPMRTRVPVHDGWGTEMFGGWYDSAPTMARSPSQTSIATDDDQTMIWGTSSTRRKRPSFGTPEYPLHPSRDRNSPFKGRSSMASAATIAEDEQCDQCGCDILHRDGRRGTGEFARKIYCKPCWSEWTAS